MTVFHPHLCHQIAMDSDIHKRTPKIRLLVILEEMVLCVCVCLFVESWKCVIFPVLLNIILGIQLHPHKTIVGIQGDNVCGKSFENCEVLHKWKTVLLLSSQEFSYTSNTRWFSCSIQPEW